MPVTVPTAVEVVSCISTGSELAPQHPETLVLHMLGQERLARLRRKLETDGTPDVAWHAYSVLYEAMLALYPMILEPCSDDLAARRCEWYARVLRATEGA